MVSNVGLDDAAGVVAGTPVETAQLFSSILGECTSYQIAGTLTKDGSSTITEEIAESLLRVSLRC